MTDWKGAPTRLTAYLPDDMVALIQRDARAKGQSLTTWMRRAAEAALGDYCPKCGGMLVPSPYSDEPELRCDDCGEAAQAP